MNKFNFDKVLLNVARMKRELPIVVAKETQKEFVQHFKDQGFDGKPWAKPNRVIPGTDEFKYPMKKGLSRRTKPTLVMTGALRRATSNSIRSSTFEMIRLVVGLPYAVVHNEGTATIPQRQFIGQTPALTRIQESIIKKHMDKIWH